MSAKRLLLLCSIYPVTVCYLGSCCLSHQTTMVTTIHSEKIIPSLISPFGNNHQLTISVKLVTTMAITVEIPLYPPIFRKTMNGAIDSKKGISQFLSMNTGVSQDSSNSAIVGPKMIIQTTSFLLLVKMFLYLNLDCSMCGFISTAPGHPVTYLLGGS